ncbi:hypothetical protein KKB83_01830 [Patescibacteria group bacterium]|nr:hypothetical protein [Patescibacteria group bacterium]
MAEKHIVPAYKDDSSIEAGEQSKNFEIREISASTGSEVLDALPDKFDSEAVIEVKGKVRGREETQIVQIRIDVENVRLDENNGFWALVAEWSDGDEDLLMNGNYFDRDGEDMRDYTTSKGEWDWRAEGMGMIGKLTPWDVYNIGRFNEVEKAVLKHEVTSEVA